MGSVVRMAKSPAQRVKILIVLGMMSLLTALSGSSTNLAMPRISEDLMISSSAATWIVSIGLITTAVLLVMFGHIGDLVSKNLVFLIGEVVFIVGSLLTGIAPTYLTIMAGRVVQAVGSAMIMANSMGIISQYFPDANRAEALAVISMFVSLGSISGPAFGGILITWASWRWIYLFNVPVGILIVLAGMRLLPLRRPAHGEIRRVWQQANWTGQNLFTGGMILMFASGYWLQQPKQLWLGAGILAGGILLTILAFIQDQRSRSPWIAPSIMHKSGLFNFSERVVDRDAGQFGIQHSSPILPAELWRYISVRQRPADDVAECHDADDYAICRLAGRSLESLLPDDSWLVRPDHFANRVCQLSRQNKHGADHLADCRQRCGDGLVPVTE